VENTEIEMCPLSYTNYEKNVIKRLLK
jgi:hypothetical protein